MSFVSLLESCRNSEEELLAATLQISLCQSDVLEKFIVDFQNAWTNMNTILSNCAVAGNVLVGGAAVPCGFSNIKFEPGSISFDFPLLEEKVENWLFPDTYLQFLTILRNHGGITTSLESAVLSRRLQTCVRVSFSRTSQMTMMSVILTLSRIVVKP